MSKAGDFYRQNVYGVMGTLVFHILFVLSFLLAEVDIKGNMREEEIVIEFPDILPEPEEILPEEADQQKELPAEPSAQNLNNQNQIYCALPLTV